MLELDSRHLPSKLATAIKQQLTVPNPERGRAGRGAAGNLPPVVQLYRQEGSKLLLPRGSTAMLQQKARQHQVELVWDSHVVTRAERSVELADLPLPLRPYQGAGVRAMLEKVQGYVRAPCGSGKTVMGASALVATGEPSVVFVHTHDLMEQWVGLFASWNYRVRAIAKGETQLLQRPLEVVDGRPEIAVCMVQTVMPNLAHADPLLTTCGAVLLDEAHHAPADTFRAPLEACTARYRWGVTATPNRDDGWDVLLPLTLGPQLWSISMAALVRLGFLLRPQLVALASGARVPPSSYRQGDRTNMSRALNRLVQDESRNGMLLDLCEMLARYRRTTLLLVPRVKQAGQLAQALLARGVAAMSVTSQADSVLRGDRLRQLRERKMQVVVATQLADEGLDVPTLDVVINASTGKAAGRAIQRMGRVMRPAEGKKNALFVDVVDPAPFGQQWHARARAYRAELGVVVPKPLRRQAAFDQIRLLL